ncbi:hypothetical protein OENOO_58061, partial [Oenococcus oeni ATCC BAA-1163]
MSRSLKKGPLLIHRCEEV